MRPQSGIRGVGDGGHATSTSGRDALAVLAAGEASEVELAAQLQLRLSTSVAVLVEQFAPDGDHRRLEALGHALGTPSIHDVSNPESPIVHRVEPLTKPELDARGRPILSTTPRTFPCHSDDFSSTSPADLILLQCVSPASCGGGQTLLAPAREITGALPARTLELMRAYRWPAPGEPGALLFGDADDPHLRYHGAVLDRTRLPFRQRRARTAVARAVQGATFELALAAGDLLIIDNARALHGRTSMQPGSGRLLLRMRVHRAPLPAPAPGAR